MFPWRGRYYLDQLGMRLVARINRVSPSSITHRFERYLTTGFREHEHRPRRWSERSRGPLQEDRRDHGAGLAPHGPSRVRAHSSEAGRLGLRGARPSGHGMARHRYELSARSPSKLDKKCRPYRIMAQSGASIPLLFICATDRAEANVLNVAGGLPVMTCTVDRADRGALAGAETVWAPRRSRDCPRFPVCATAARHASVTEEDRHVEFRQWEADARLFVLAVLFAMPWCSAEDLARVRPYSRAYLGKLLQSLEAEGLVYRVKAGHVAGQVWRWALEERAWRKSAKDAV